MVTLPKPNEMWVAAAIPAQKTDSLGRRTWHLAWVDAAGRPRGQVSYTTLEGIIERQEARGGTVRRVSLREMEEWFEGAKAEQLSEEV